MSQISDDPVVMMGISDQVFIQVVGSLISMAFVHYTQYLSWKCQHIASVMTYGTCDELRMNI